MNCVDNIDCHYYNLYYNFLKFILKKYCISRKNGIKTLVWLNRELLLVNGLERINPEISLEEQIDHLNNNSEFPRDRIILGIAHPYHRF